MKRKLAIGLAAAGTVVGTVATMGIGGAIIGGVAGGLVGGGIGKNRGDTMRRRAASGPETPRKGGSARGFRAKHLWV